jgi:hypothetical protein
MSIDDIPLAVAGRDICAYITAELEGLSGLGCKESAALAEKAHGLFEWAHLACEHIKVPHFASSPLDSFNAVMTNDHGQQDNLLYNMYYRVLTEVFFRDTTTSTMHMTALARFRSVMGQIFGTTEPLPSMPCADIFRTKMTIMMRRLW